MRGKQTKKYARVGNGTHILMKFGTKNRFTFAFISRLNVYLGLKDGDQTLRQYLFAEFKLLFNNLCARNNYMCEILMGHHSGNAMNRQHTCFIPERSAELITLLILVPRMLFASAASHNSSRLGIGFISCTPSFSGSSPLSTLRIGTIDFFFQRYSAVGIPSIFRFIVSSNRIAPRILSPWNFGDVIIRVLILWTWSNMDSSPTSYSSSLMP